MWWRAPPRLRRLRPGTGSMEWSASTWPGPTTWRPSGSRFSRTFPPSSSDWIRTCLALALAKPVVAERPAPEERCRPRGHAAAGAPDLNDLVGVPPSRAQRASMAERVGHGDVGETGSPVVREGQRPACTVGRRLADYLC